MSAPSFQVDALAWLQHYAAEAERDLRTMHPESDPRNRLPQRLEDELARKALNVGTPESLLLRYATCRARLAEGVSQDRQAEAAAGDVTYDIITRAPYPLTFSNGQRHPIYSKSVLAYERMAELWTAFTLLEAAASALHEQQRLSDLLLLRDARRACEGIRRELLGLALHPDADPPAGAEPPAWSRTLTHEDMSAIQIAHVAVGAGRYQQLPDPRARTKSDRDPSREGFGHFIAAIADRRKASEDAILRADWWQLLARLRLAAQAQPGPSADDLEDL